MAIINRTGYIILFLFLLVSCSSKPAQVPQIKETSLVTEKLSDKPAWEKTWDKAVQEARKEGTVIIYSTANTTVRTAIGDAFKQKFGIVLESITGRGAEQVIRLLNERKNNLYLADIYMAGTTTPVSQLKPEGVLAPLEPQLMLPDVVDPKLWFGGELPWVDPQHTILGSLAYSNALILVNTQMVKQGEIGSLRDLLNPKWKGKIIMNDPTVAGTGSKSFTVIGWELLNLDYWRDFARQEPLIMRDQRLLVEWVARGKYSIAFAPRPPEVSEFKAAGAPITYVTPAEGTYLSTGSAGISMINKAPHPNASKVFLNWLLSREGQTVFTQAHGGQSARIDVTTEGLDPDLMRQPGVKYFGKADTEEWLLKEDQRRETAKEIFGPLMK